MSGVSTFTQDAATQICERIASGSSIRKVASDLDISKATIFKWLSDFPTFSDQYTRAKEAQAELLADEIIEIADTANGENAHAIRVRVDARKWVAAKLLPQKYGERLTVNGQIISLSLPMSAVADFAPVLEGKAVKHLEAPEE